MTTPRTATTEWKNTTTRIKARDHYQCVAALPDGSRCERRHRLQVDHITPVELGGTDDDVNLQTLCTWHHARKTERDQAKIRALRTPTVRQRERSAHPGLLPAVEK